MYYRKILGLALPAMGEHVLQMAMGTVDSYLVAQLGVAAISGVSVANNLMSIYQAIFIGLATSAASLVAQGVASRRRLATSLGLTGLVAGLLGGLAVFLGEPLFETMGLDLAVAQGARTYFAWVGGGSLFLGLMTVLSSLVRAQGRSRLPLVVNLLTSVINLILSALFLYGFNLGVEGVALGTVLARLIGSLVLWYLLADRPRGLVDVWPWDMAVLTTSLPLVGERLMMRAGDVVVISLVAQLGTQALASQALGETLVQFNYMPGLGLAVAALILVAQTPQVQDQKTLLTQLYLVALVLMYAMSGLSFLLSPYTLPLFTNNVAVSQGARIVILFSLLDVPVTAGTLVLTATWQGLGQPQKPFYATTLGIWVFRVMGSWFLTQVFGLGLVGVYLAIVLDNACRVALLYPAYGRYWRQKQLIGN